ncbi:MAG: fibronectin type III domain-containing protein [Dolichospermum sp.]
MKKLYTLLALIITLIATAQAPQGFNYQATVRNSAGALIVNQNVNFKFNIMLNSQTSVPIFSETHYVPTDDLGQVNLTVGEGTATIGSFSAINWGTGNYYLGIELNTGNGYVAMGTTQLLSVPYALYANSAGSSQSQGKPSIYLTGDITNAEAAARIASQLGPVTENIYIQNTTQLTTVDLSAMEYAADISIRDNNVLTSINLSGLKDCYVQLGIDGNPLLTNVSFPALTNSSYIYITLNPLLTTVSFPLLTNSRNINLNSNALSIATINALLNKMLSVLPSTGKYIDLRQNPPAIPSGQGIIDKQTLLNAGNNVHTDEFSAPTLTTTVASAITISTANCGGSIIYSGGGFITSKGLVWSNSNNPTIENNMGMTSEGSGSGSFTSNLSGLLPNTTYYVRSYASSNESGTGYGQEETFLTLPELPLLTTLAISAITGSTAISGGNITNSGVSSILTRGVVWSTITNPTITTNQGMTTDGTGIGNYASNLSGLLPNRTYYLRAYANNSIGIGYGDQLSFNTSIIPGTVQTFPVTSITSNSATCGWNVTDYGGGTGNNNYIIWSDTPNPTFDTPNVRVHANLNSTYNYTMTSLLPNTTYYVRSAVSTYNPGTTQNFIGYGEVKVFTTLP